MSDVYVVTVDGDVMLAASSLMVAMSYVDSQAEENNPDRVETERLSNKDFVFRFYNEQNNLTNTYTIDHCVMDMAHS